MRSVIYVRLQDEGVDVWRPVDATIEADGTYRLPTEMPEDEVWQFAAGSRVRCEERLLSDGRALVATALAGD